MVNESIITKFLHAKDTKTDSGKKTLSPFTTSECESEKVIF